MNGLVISVVLVVLALGVVAAIAVWLYSPRCRTKALLRANKRLLRQKGQSAIESPPVTVVTYGDAAFTKSLATLQAELQPYVEAGLVSSLRAYTPQHLAAHEEFTLKEYIPDIEPAARQHYARGGGYWLWKPFVVYDTLQDMQDGDVLMYTDAGCSAAGLEEGRESWQAMLQRLADSPSGILAVSLGTFLKQRHWTRRAVCDALGVAPNSVQMREPQIAATHFWIRKTPTSMAVVSRWWQLAREQPHLFLDVPPHEVEHEAPGFKEARHDQAVWSMLLYTMLSHRDLSRSIVPVDPYEDTRGRCGPWYLRFTRRRMR